MLNVPFLNSNVSVFKLCFKWNIFVKYVIFVSGDLNKLNSGKKIIDFISDRNIDLIELPGLDVIDYGGMVEL